jgi:hypothetical protein
MTSWRSSASNCLASCRAVRTRWAVRPNTRTVARCSTGSPGAATSPGAGAELLAPGAPPQAVAQRLRSSDDEGLELAAGVRPGRHDAGPGDMQHPDRLPVPTLARAREVVASQGFAAGPDGVQGVALGAVAAPGPLGPVDLNHPLALVDQEPGQPGPIAPPSRAQTRRPGACSSASWSSRAWPARSLPPEWPAPRRWGPAGPRRGGRGGYRPR